MCDGKFQLRVQDNGRGIVQEKLENSKSFGLLGMEERAWAIGADLEIIGSPRSGTTVTLTVPISADLVELNSQSRLLP